MSINAILALLGLILCAVGGAIGNVRLVGGGGALIGLAILLAGR